MEVSGISRYFIAISLCLLGSCSLIDRRDYANIMDSQSFQDDFLVPNRDFEVIAGDSERGFWGEEDIRNRTPANAYDQAEIAYHQSLRQELMTLESRLNEDEYQNYSNARKFLRTDSERIYFLRLGPHEQGEYMAARGLVPLGRENRPEQARFSPGLSLGMSKYEVMQLWGQPDRRDYAGQPENENERWAYSRSGTTKYIYFEAGQVEGWTQR